MSKFPFMAAAAAILALSGAAAAQATSISGATSVTITNADQTYLQVGEVVADDFNGVDVTLATNGAAATALNEYASGAGPDNAIDGNLNTDYYGSGGIYHSAGTVSDYLTVDFASPANLSSLTVYGRTDCCQGRDLYDVTISGASGVLYTGQLDATTSLSGAATLNFTSAAPEPSIWMLMIAGVAMIGGALRLGRKRGAGSLSVA